MQTIVDYISYRFLDELKAYFDEISAEVLRVPDKVPIDRNMIVSEASHQLGNRIGGTFKPGLKNRLK